MMESWKGKMQKAQHLVGYEPQPPTTAVAKLIEHGCDHDFINSTGNLKLLTLEKGTIPYRTIFDKLSTKLHSHMPLKP